MNECRFDLPAAGIRPYIKLGEFKFVQEGYIHCLEVWRKRNVLCQRHAQWIIILLFSQRKFCIISSDCAPVVKLLTIWRRNRLQFPFVCTGIIKTIICSLSKGSRSICDGCFMLGS